MRSTSTRSRRVLLTGLASLVLVRPSVAFAQQKGGRVFRIGYLDSSTSVGRRPYVENVVVELEALNYVEGKNLVVERRFAEDDYDRLSRLADELVKLKVDVIVAVGTPATLAAKKGTSTIPIVMVNTGDAVGSGLVTSLARPGGNITGTTIYGPELMVKRLELLREALPQLRRVAVPVNSVNPGAALGWQAVEAAAKVLKIEVRRFEVRHAEKFEAVFAEMAKQGVDGLVISTATLFMRNVTTIADLVAKHRVAAIGPNQFAPAGILMTYGIHLSENVSRVVYFVDRILKGAKPADLPVELPTRFELIVNLKTAKALGVTIASSVLTRADTVVE